MKIEARIDKMIHRDDTNTKAYASASIDGEFVIRNLKIVGGQNGDFVSMPRTREANGKFQDLFYPITAESRKELHDTVLRAYDNKLKELQEQKADRYQSAESNDIDAHEEGAISDDSQEDEQETDQEPETEDMRMAM